MRIAVAALAFVQLGALGLAGTALADPAWPEAGLLAAAERRIEQGREVLRESIGHYGLVYDVDQRDVRRFITRVYPRRDGRDLVMGGIGGVELHGGGVLALLLRYWQPGGRPARLTDRCSFPLSRSPIALSEIDHSHRMQVFLPVDGREIDTISGALPDSPQLPRMFFRFVSDTGEPESTEVDAYHYLQVLVAHEEDLDARWTNRLGQSLSAERLLGHTWDHYRARSGERDYLADHSSLHMIGVLLPYSRRSEGRRDPSELKQSFLANELGRGWRPGKASTEVLAHHVESLGLLLQDDRLTWSQTEKAQAKAWLSSLSSSNVFEADDVPLQHLSHLVFGLRAIERNRQRLR